MQVLTTGAVSAGSIPSCTTRGDSPNIRIVEVDDIISYHDVVTAEIWGAVAAATWFRRLAETSFEFPFDFARIISRL